MNAEPAIAAEAKRSAYSLFGIKISLLPKIISLTIFSGKLHRNGCGTGAFCTVFASKTPEIAKFPVNFPVTREIRMETGSHQTAHTALLILSASVNVVASIFFISILGLTCAAIATTDRLERSDGILHLSATAIAAGYPRNARIETQAIPGATPLVGTPNTLIQNPCVYRKLKLGRSGGEVRQGWRVISDKVFGTHNRQDRA